MGKNHYRHIEKKFHDTIGQYIFISGNEKILLGISGGSDSMALLSLFYQEIKASRIVVVYVNHGLRPEEAQKESDYLREFCGKIGVFFISTEVAVKKHASLNRQSIEEAARFLRYRAFHKLAKENSCEIIAVAHTADDQVENFFIRLIRGAGVRGIKGMSSLSGKIFRPLLDFQKKELQHYLIEKRIRWFEDSSNCDLRFLRNRVRLELLPLLEEKFSPAISTHVLQLMNIVTEENEFLLQELEKIWSRLVKVKEDIQHSRPALLLDCKGVAKEHRALQRRLVEKCCWQMMGSAEFSHIENIRALILDKGYGQLHLPEGLRVEKTGNHLVFHFPLAVNEKRGSGKKEEKTFQLVIREPGSYFLPNHQESLSFSLKTRNKKSGACIFSGVQKGILTLSFDTLSFPLLVRSPMRGDQFIPYNRMGSKKVARYFSEKKVPLSTRKSWPLLVSNGEIIAIAGMEIADSCKITTTTRTILTVEYSGFFKKNTINILDKAERK